MGLITVYSPAPCPTASQFKTIAPNVDYVLGVTPVNRDLSNKGKGGGWRWRKWGPYIGVKTPTTEYLDDEPEIDSVLVYHLYEVSHAYSDSIDGSL